MNKNNAQARCGFCDRDFRSAQAVRAHLKSCTLYQETKRRKDNPPNTASGTLRQPGRELPKAKPGKAPDVRPSIEEQARRRKEAARNSQKEINDYWRQEAEKAERRRCQERKEAELQRQKDEADSLLSKKRQIVQEVKSRVVDWHFSLHNIPNEAKARVKIEIERVLATLPVSELPITELIQIGEGIRDKVYAPYEKTVDVHKQPNREEIAMSKERLISGIYLCANCDQEFDIQRETEAGLICEDCGGRLEEVTDGDEYEDGEEED